MYKETNNITKIIDYLKKQSYANISKSLFDRYLWFYSSIETLNYKLSYGIHTKAHVLYVNEIADEIVGVAYLDLKETKLLIETKMYSDVQELIKVASIVVKKYYEANKVPINIKIVVNGEELASYIANITDLNYSFGQVKYYTEEKRPLLNNRARELLKKDAYLLDKLPERVWGGYKYMLDQGYRFFGLIKSDRLLAMCGLSRLTAFQSQIIGVETFQEMDRRKGYAQDVCLLALNQGLESVETVTWSTNLSNNASCKTAEGLGFQMYYSLYNFEYPIK